VSSDDYVSGEWRSLDRVLALLQTYETNTLDRKQIYKDVMELRPKGLVEDHSNS